MGEAFWAAREGDALLHTSFLADLVGSALEFAINAVIDFAALAVVALATGATVATLGCSAVLLVGTVVGATMLLSGAGEKISKACEDIANSLFPPKIEGYILTGSGDTRINSKRAARRRQRHYHAMMWKPWTRRRRQRQKKKNAGRTPNQCGMWPGNIWMQ